MTFKYIYIYNTAVLIKICRFLINVVKFTQTLTKWDLPTLRKGSIEERTQRNKKKSGTRWESNPGPRLFLCRCSNRYATGASGRTRIFILISFQILNSPRCVPFMWTFIHYMLLIVFLFFLHNCQLLIPLHNTAVLIKICRF